jgi:hypothetical protein
MFDPKTKVRSTNRVMMPSGCVLVVRLTLIDKATSSTSTTLKRSSSLTFLELVGPWISSSTFLRRRHKPSEQVCQMRGQ